MPHRSCRPAAETLLYVSTLQHFERKTMSAHRPLVSSVDAWDYCWAKDCSFATSAHAPESTLIRGILARSFVNYMAAEERPDNTHSQKTCVWRFASLAALLADAEVKQYPDGDVVIAEVPEV